MGSVQPHILSKDEIAEALEPMHNWYVASSARSIETVIACKTTEECTQIILHLVEMAQVRQYLPDFRKSDLKITVTLCTKNVMGVTMLDIEFANHLDDFIEDLKKL